MSRTTVDRKTDSTVWVPEEMRGIHDLSLHRVWWRRHWVLWFDQPLLFERRRPWSHHRSARILLMTLALATAALWALTIVFASIGWGIPAAGATLALGGYAAAVTIAEVRFWAWWSRNDDRGILDAFRRPAILHGDLTDSKKAVRAIGKIGNPEELAEEYVCESGRGLRGWRAYGTGGWVRVIDVVDVQPLVRLYQALSEWRQLNEVWSEEAAWEAEFNAKPQRKSLFKVRRRQISANPLERSAEKVLDATRDVDRAMETVSTTARDQLAPASPRKERRRDGWHPDWEVIGFAVPIVALGLSVIIAIGIVLFNTAAAIPSASDVAPTSSASQTPAAAASHAPTSQPAPKPEATTPQEPATHNPSESSSDDRPITDSLDAVYAPFLDLFSRFWWVILLFGLFLLVGSIGMRW